MRIIFLYKLNMFLTILILSIVFSSFLCPTEIFDLDARISEFESINTSVVAVSTDSRFSHLAAINTPKSKYGFGDTKIPLLSDFNKTISSDYGILVDQAGVALR